MEAEVEMEMETEKMHAFFFEQKDLDLETGDFNLRFMYESGCQDL